MARLSRTEEDQKTIRGIVFPTKDVTLMQGRGQLGLDIAVEDLAVHRPVEHPRRVQAIMAQCRDEGLASAWCSNQWRIHASIQWPKGA